MSPDLSRRIRLRGRLVRAGRRLLLRPLEENPPTEPFRRYHRLRRRLRPARYTDADPLAIRWIDPTAIRLSILETAPRYPQRGVVAAGDWDRAGEPFWERPVPRAVVARFRDGRPWQETPLHDYFADQLRRFGNAWGYASIAGFDERCAEIERLYGSMRDEGYHSQRELAGPPLDEITVDIARDGTLLWQGYGQHRLAIAAVLGIDRVPALVGRRHREWQRRREAVRTGESPLGADHPDLTDLADFPEDGRR